MIPNPNSNHSLTLSEYLSVSLSKDFFLDDICLKAIKHHLYHLVYLRDCKRNDWQEYWLFEAYMRTVNPAASYQEVVDAIPGLKEDPVNVLEFIVESVTERIREHREFEDILLSYDPAGDPVYISVSHEAQTPIYTRVTMSDTIQDIAQRLRQKVTERQGKTISPDWEEDSTYDVGYTPVTSNDELLRLLGF